MFPLFRTDTVQWWHAYWPNTSGYAVRLFIPYRIRLHVRSYLHHIFRLSVAFILDRKIATEYSTGVFCTEHIYHRFEYKIRSHINILYTHNLESISCNCSGLCCLTFACYPVAFYIRCAPYFSLSSSFSPYYSISISIFRPIPLINVSKCFSILLITPYDEMSYNFYVLSIQIQFSQLLL